jgi:cell division transport system ATP-binding protein
MIENSIRITNVTKSYGADPIFEGINAFIPSKSFVFLTGKSGSGKSTLLKMIHRIEKIDEGEVVVGDYTDRTADTELRKNIGFVFQDYKLLENRSAEENIQLPLFIRGVSTQRAKKKIKTIAEECGVRELLKKKVCNLSGGEKQLIALVRAAITSPILVLADEPTANLDSEAAKKVLYLLDKMHRKGATILLATHDISLIQSRPATIFLIQDQKIKKVGVM